MPTQATQIEQPVTWTAGEDITFTVTMNLPTNITGWTLELRLFSNDWSEELEAIDGPTITDPTNGIFWFDVPAFVTGTTLGRGRFRYSVWRTDSGNNKKLAYGQITAL
jgi:hypothetical protein